MDRINVNVNGMSIETVVAGAPEHRPLVLLHGYPTSSHLWRNVMPGLAAHHRVYAPDLPGHGGSDKPGNVEYDLDLFVGFLRGFADAVGLDRFALVGHDLGGMVAIGFAARYTDQLSRLVIMDTAPYVTWPLAARLVIWLARTPLTARMLLSRHLFRLFMQLGVANRRVMTTEVAEQYRRPWIQDSAGRRAFSLTVAVPPERITEPRPNLTRITVPTLVLWAANDRLFGKRVARQLRDDLPDATMTVVPDCGHFLQEEQPELIVQHLRSFLSGA